MQKLRRVEKALLAEPFFLFHQLGVHDRDLTGGSAEADETQLEPEPQRFAKGGSNRHALEASRKCLRPPACTWGSLRLGPRSAVSSRIN